jgi:catechol-2,3-dioxygenase
MECGRASSRESGHPAREERKIMNTVGLSHFNITVPAELLERVRDFYIEVVGLVVGERPGFMRRGFWLYAGREPIVHLTVCDAADERARGVAGPSFFDHIAFSGKGLAALIERLKHMNIPYEVVEISSLRQTQIFLRDPASVGIELNFVNESLA